MNGVIKFRLVKFEKSILFQLIDHRFDKEWIDKMNRDYCYRGKDLNIYFKLPGLSISYISLEVENSERKVKVLNFTNNSDRDRYYNLFLRELTEFAKSKTFTIQK